MASTLLQSISQDDYEKARFLSRLKFQNDMESDKNMAINIAKFEIAKNMLRRGTPLQHIIEDTGLTEKQIKELQGDN